MNKMLCPICKEGFLTEHIRDRSVIVDGKEKTVPFEFSHCDECGCEIPVGEQAKNNAKAMREASK